MTEESLSLMDKENIDTNFEINERSLIEEAPKEEPSPAPLEAPKEEAASKEVVEEPEKSREDLKEDSPKDEPKKTFKLSPAAEAVKKEIDAQEEISMKLQMIVQFMEQAISQEGSPRFKDFWSGREICMELFKETMPAIVRKSYWEKYRELSTEARRLKQILDEQSSFAVEQIDTAIAAIEKDLENREELIETTPQVEFPKQQAIRDLRVFQELQKELNLINALSSQVTSLRKELIATEMRIKHKNKFFKRLSVLGDLIFPRRKELIKEVSHLFIEEINRFHAGFSTQLSKKSFGLRNEIKSLQSIAKVLTLNTGAFNQTRTKLSECWDQLKEIDKQYKKELSEKREVFKENEAEMLSILEEILGGYEKNELTMSQAEDEVSGLLKTMRARELGRDEVVNLKSKIKEFTDGIDATRAEQEKKRLEIEREKEKERLKVYTALREEIDALKASFEQGKWDELDENLEPLVAKLDEPKLKRSEKKECQRVLKPLQEAVCERRELALIEGCSGEAEEYQQLKAILKDRKLRREEIKEQLEVLRKKSGSSGSDFEKLMEYQEQMHTEKERLQTIDDGIVEVEEKISAIKNSSKK